METLWKDLRFALRMLRRSPGVAAAAVIALALGIGANTAIFSVVDGVLLRPLPYQDSRALHVINGKFPSQGLQHVPISHPEFKDILEQTRTLAAVAVFAQGDSNLSGQGAAPDRVVAGLASATFFPTLGVQPILGRNFLAAEERQGNDQVVLLDHGLWQRRFASDPNVTGKELILDNLPYRIIGVLPKGFQIEQKCDLWIPISTSIDMVSVRGAHWLKGVARAKPGVTQAQIAADLEAISERLRETYPNNYKRGVGWGLEAKPLIDDVVGDVRLALWVLLGAVGFVLLIACANVANLMLARAAARNKEMAIRTALGAKRWRLIRQMLTESLILSVAGGALGLLLAVWGVDAMVAMSPDALPRSTEVALDARVLAFTFGVSILTGIAFGLMPALSASRPDLNDSLKDGTRGTSSSRGRLRRALVVAEVGLSMVLLVGTGLMLRSFLQLRDINPGFRPDHVLTMRVSLPTPNGTWTEEDKARFTGFFSRAARRLGELPGVTAAGAITILPLDGDSSDNSFEIENYVPKFTGDLPDSEVREVAPGYFAAMGIPLIRGRLLSEADSKDAPPVVVINQAMAKRYWPNEDPLGKHLKINSKRAPVKEWTTVVGIVGDVRGFGLDKPAKTEMYYHLEQLRRAAGMALVIRTTGDPTTMANAARAAIGEIDAKQPIFNIRTMEDYLARSMAQRRFSLVLMLIFAGVALLLAAVGIYGVMSYTVAQRTQEIGIRVALGATPGRVLGMVVKEGMTLVGIGLGAGLAASLALTRVVSSLLYGVSASDALTYLIIAVALGGVALAATIIPARRATRVDPMNALRSD
jgi:putative ABC transport system permease protein